MDNLVKTVKETMYPIKEKTFVDHCGEYVRDHPGTVAKGTAVGVVALCTAPIIITGLSWAPYIGVGYFLYSKTRATQQAYSWYQWGQSWF